jgi:hypothetical protein
LKLLKLLRLLFHYLFHWATRVLNWYIFTPNSNFWSLESKSQVKIHFLLAPRLDLFVNHSIQKATS